MNADVIAAVEHAIQQRDASTLHNGEILFRCPRAARHTNGDADPSARWNPAKQAWFCHPCGAGGGYQKLAEELGIATTATNGHARRKTDKLGTLVKVYAYVDEQRRLRFQTCRYQKPKDFRQRRPDGNGGWINNLDGVERIVYRLPDVLAAIANGDPVFIVEGEKDADTLATAGLCGTCNPMGAGKWRPEYNATFAGADVVILPDNDEAGHAHGETVRNNLLPIANTVRMIDLPGLPLKGDVSDWFAAGHTAGDLLEIVAATDPIDQTTFGSANAAEQTASDFALIQHCTDLGNAKRFALQHAGHVKYVERLGGWHLWDDRRYQRDEIGAVFRLAEKTVASIWGEVELAHDRDERKRIADHAHKSESEARIRAMLSLAQSENSIAARPSDFDRDPLLLNVLNGTVDLRTATLRPHRQADLITKLAPVNYDPDATCPTFDAFSERILPSAELRAFLQKAVGYSLTADTREQVLFLLWGSGANGKSTLLETLRNALGEYSRQADFSTFLAKKEENVRNDLARLVGARFVAAIEVESGKRLAEATVKQLTGGDTITARFLYREHFEFHPSFKLWLGVNHKPRIRGTEHAIWRRIRLVPFLVTIADKDQDRQLPEKLRAELPGVLRWAVEGCLAWQRDGLGEPDEVANATKAYREESDTLAPFFDEVCELQASASATAADLYKAYAQWCEQSGERVESQRSFGTQLTDRGLHRERSSTTGRYMWLGIRLRNA